MEKESKLLQHINGKQLYYSFVAGAQKIFEHQKAINKINVFPVPDGDTGTNLASTMRSIVDTSIPSKNFKEAAVSLADAALIGARGNSGIIFAQFLYGFSNELANTKTVDVKAFSMSVSKAVDYAYQSIQNPVEGTMITVIKDWAESLHGLQEKITDFKKLLTDSYQRAKQSLQETTQKLEVLAKNKVVDAGAKGFVVFLEGILEFFINGKIKELLKNQSEIVAFDDKVEIVSHDNITFRYCTEALISGENMDNCKILKKMESYGDSVVVAGSPSKVRVHVHTDEPAKLFSDIYHCGTIIHQKVDDMVFQNEITKNRKHPIALLTDSTSDLPKEIREKHQIHVVPLTVHFGENYFLDGVTLNPDRFYKMLETSEVQPTSAQPTYKDFYNRYDYLGTHYDSIIGMHVTGAMSGTVSNSGKAAENVARESAKKISVIDTKRITGALGLIIIRAAEELEKGTDHDTLVKKIEKWSKDTEIMVSVKTLKYMIRSGRLSPMKGFIANLLHLKPLITVDEEGKSAQHAKSFSEKGSMKKIVKRFEEISKGKKVWGYTITHANNKESADWYIEKLTALTGKEPKYIQEVSPVIGTNAGTGAVCVSLMFE